MKQHKTLCLLSLLGTTNSAEFWSKKVSFTRSSTSTDSRFKLIPGNTCGNFSSIPYSGFKTRIVGSDTFSASKGQFPWQAALMPCQNSKSSDNTVCNQINVCGASIISDFWLVSAAHCTVDMKLAASSIRIGSTKFMKGGKSYKLRSYVNHPYYNDQTMDNDVSLIKTMNKMEFSRFALPICLPSVDHCFQAGSEAWVSGYGINDVERSYGAGKELRAVKVPLASHKKCSEDFMEKQNINHITESNICASGDNLGDSCGGDSGGPLAVSYYSIWYLYGVVSWGVSCASEMPGVYTRVTSQLNWIKSETEADIDFGDVRNTFETNYKSCVEDSTEITDTIDCQKRSKAVSCNKANYYDFCARYSDGDDTCEWENSVSCASKIELQSDFYRPELSGDYFKVKDDTFNGSSYYYNFKNRNYLFGIDSKNNGKIWTIQNSLGEIGGQVGYYAIGGESGDNECPPETRESWNVFQKSRFSNGNWLNLNENFKTGRDFIKMKFDYSNRNGVICCNKLFLQTDKDELVFELEGFNSGDLPFYKNFKTGYFLYGMKNDKKRELIYAVGPVVDSKENIAAYFVTDWGSCPSSGKSGMFSFSPAIGGFDLKYDYSISCERAVVGSWSDWTECDCDKLEQVRFRGESYEQVRQCGECENISNESHPSTESVISTDSEGKAEVTEEKSEVSDEIIDPAGDTAKIPDSNVADSGLGLVDVDYDRSFETSSGLEINEFVNFNDGISSLIALND